MAVGANILPQKWHAMAARGENDGFRTKITILYLLTAGFEFQINFSSVERIYEKCGVFSSF